MVINIPCFSHFKFNFKESDQHFLVRTHYTVLYLLSEMNTFVLHLCVPLTANGSPVKASVTGWPTA